MRHRVTAIVFGLLLLGGGRATAETVLFRYGVDINAYAKGDLISADGDVRPGTLFIAGTPEGVDTRNLDLYVTLLASPVSGGDSYQVAMLGCHPGDIVAGRAAIYSARSCDQKTIRPVSAGDQITEIVTRTRFPAADIRDADAGTHNFTISATTMQRVDIEAWSGDAATSCQEIADKVDLGSGGELGISARVYSLPAARSQGKGKWDIAPQQICVFAAPRIDAVMDLEPFGAVYSTGGQPGDEALVGAFNCATQAIGHPQPTDMVVDFPLGSCNVEPEMLAAKVDRSLFVKLGFAFGSFSTDEPDCPNCIPMGRKKLLPYP